MARRLALVTGASAGIGAALARAYAAHGYDVALTARRADRLEQLASEISLRFGVEALSLPADMAEAQAADQVLAALGEQGRVVDALVNNAGYGLTGSYAGTSWPDQAAQLQVMLTSVCELTHRVLPGMVEQGFGRILNVASLAGLLPGTAGHTQYAAIKAFLIRFSQSIHLENMRTGVHCTALCPGMTYSEFHDVNGTRDMVGRAIPAWMWLGADEVAGIGYEAAEANRPVCVTGAPNKAIAALAKILPDDWAMALVARQTGRYRKA
jgi:uncharacterized protein